MNVLRFLTPSEARRIVKKKYPKAFVQYESYQRYSIQNMPAHPRSCPHCNTLLDKGTRDTFAIGQGMDEGWAWLDAAKHVLNKEAMSRSSPRMWDIRYSHRHGYGLRSERVAAST